MGLVGEVVARLGGVVAKEVDRFTNLRNGIREGLARLTDKQAHQLLHLAFHLVRGTLKDVRAFGRQRGLPDWPRSLRRIEGVPYISLGGFIHLTNQITLVRRVSYGLSWSVRTPIATKHWSRDELAIGAAKQCRGQRAQAMFIGQVDAGRIEARSTVKFARQRNPGVR
ncbi:hypothetical protein D9M69_617980 [compost metagenome]